jgi:hypothetical protein
LQIVRDRRDSPIALPNPFCFGEKVWEGALRNFPLPHDPLFQQLPSAAIKLTGEFGEKIYRFIRQNLCVLPDDGASDFNSYQRRSFIHCYSPGFHSLLRFKLSAASQSFPARYRIVLGLEQLEPRISRMRRINADYP